MKFKSFFKIFTESKGGVHISVDVQNEYMDNVDFKVDEYYEWMNENFNKVIVYINGEELGFPPKEEHIEWLFEQGVEPDILYSGKFEFREKDYAFFRSCMDENLEDCLVEIIKYMFENEIIDSREIDLEDNPFSQRSECNAILDFIVNQDMISIPDLMYELQSDNLTQVSVSGGSDTECLEEVRLALQALDIKFIDHHQYIY